MNPGREIPKFGSSHDLESGTSKQFYAFSESKHGIPGIHWDKTQSKWIKSAIYSSRRKIPLPLSEICSDNILSAVGSRLKCKRISTVRTSGSYANIDIIVPQSAESLALDGFFFCVVTSSRWPV